MDRVELLAVLLSWASHLTSYSYPETPPDYRIEKHAFFVEHACGGRDRCEVSAWYNNDGVIYLDERLGDWQDPVVRSVIVHELVHYLQDLSGRYIKDDCEERLQREREAYSVQRTYLNRVAGRFAATWPVYDSCEG